MRFKDTEDLPLNVIAEAVERLSVEQYISIYESVIKSKSASRRKPKSKTSASPAKTTTRQRKKTLSTTKTAKSR